MPDCCCNTVIGFIPAYQDVEPAGYGKSMITEYEEIAYYKRCPIHEVNREGWFIDKINDFHLPRLTLTPEGKEYYRELQKQVDASNPYSKKKEQIKLMIDGVNRQIAYQERMRARTSWWYRHHPLHKPPASIRKFNYCGSYQKLDKLRKRKKNLEDWLWDVTVNNVKWRNGI